MKLFSKRILQITLVASVIGLAGCATTQVVPSSGGGGKGRHCTSSYQVHKVCHHGVCTKNWHRHYQCTRG